MIFPTLLFVFFFFNDTAPPEIYTLSLHDALPIWDLEGNHAQPHAVGAERIALGDDGEIDGGFGERQQFSGPGHGESDRLDGGRADRILQDRKSTRLNSSHGYISYAVFCLKKKNK